MNHFVQLRLFTFFVALASSMVVAVNAMDCSNDGDGDEPSEKQKIEASCAGQLAQFRAKQRARWKAENKTICSVCKQEIGDKDEIDVLPCDALDQQDKESLNTHSCHTSCVKSTSESGCHVQNCGGSLIQCPICYDLLSKNTFKIALSCGSEKEKHTFCFPCLSRSVKASPYPTFIQCPICRHHETKQAIVNKVFLHAQECKDWDVVGAFTWAMKNNVKEIWKVLLENEQVREMLIEADLYEEDLTGLFENLNPDDRKFLLEWAVSHNQANIVDELTKQVPNDVSVSNYHAFLQHLNNNQAQQALTIHSAYGAPAITVQHGTHHSIIAANFVLFQNQAPPITSNFSYYSSNPTSYPDVAEQSQSVIAQALLNNLASSPPLPTAEQLAAQQGSQAAVQFLLDAENDTVEQLQTMQDTADGTAAPQNSNTDEDDDLYS